MKMDKPAIKTIIQDELAIHTYIGKKNTSIFLMPYPHASSPEPIIKSELGKLLINLDYDIISFDPPGIFQSTRSPKVTLEEMIDCFQEVLNFIHFKKKFILVAHSMGGFVSFPIIEKFSDHIEKIILIGTLAGFSSIKKHHGLPYYYSIFNSNYWKIAYYGSRLMFFKGNRAIQKKIDNIFRYESWFNKSYVKLWEITEEDYHLPPHPRSRWVNTARKYNFYGLMEKIFINTLILVGRYDPQTPVGCSEEIKRGIKNSQLKIFEKSGHYPFVEEKDLFSSSIISFLEN